MSPSRGALGRHLEGLLGRLGGPRGSLERTVRSQRPLDGVMGVSRDRLGPPGLLSKGSPGRL
eukprot:4692923-Pyramimonas_sp.AAC.1